MNLNLGYGHSRGYWLRVGVKAERGVRALLGSRLWLWPWSGSVFFLPLNSTCQVPGTGTQTNLALVLHQHNTHNHNHNHRQGEIYTNQPTPKTKANYKLPSNPATQVKTSNTSNAPRTTPTHQHQAPSISQYQYQHQHPTHTPHTNPPQLQLHNAQCPCPAAADPRPGPRNTTKSTKKRRDPNNGPMTGIIVIAITTITAGSDLDLGIGPPITTGNMQH